MTETDRVGGILLMHPGTRGEQSAHILCETQYTFLHLLKTRWSKFFSNREEKILEWQFSRVEASNYLEHC